LTQPAQQQRFRFQDSELPTPLGIRVAETLALFMGFVLASLRIAVQEGLVSVFESDLRVGATCAAQTAGKNQKRCAEG